MPAKGFVDELTRRVSSVSPPKATVHDPGRSGATGTLVGVGGPAVGVAEVVVVVVMVVDGVVVDGVDGLAGPAVAPVTTEVGGTEVELVGAVGPAGGVTVARPAGVVPRNTTPTMTAPAATRLARACRLCCRSKVGRGPSVPFTAACLHLPERLFTISNVRLWSSNCFSTELLCLGPSFCGFRGRSYRLVRETRMTRLSFCLTPSHTVSPMKTFPTREAKDAGKDMNGKKTQGAEMERAKALEMALGQIDKQFGKGSIMRLGENTHMKIEAVSTGSLAVDLALGIGGLPRGRICEIYGPESSGKSTLAMHVVAEAQRNGGTCAYIDAEHAMDPVYANAIGVDIDNLLISQPDTGEQALEICDMLVRSGALDVVVIDSVAALTPKAEIEGEMGDTFVGLQARLMSQALRKLTASISRTNTVVIFINQLREKIGVMFGSPETTPGGRALKFYSSVRIDIRRIESIKDGADVTGNRTRVKIVKNKVAPPFKQAEFDIMYGKGISREGSVLDVGVECAVIKKSGAWFTYEGEQLGQGRENAKNFLTENAELMMEISEKIREKVGIVPVTGDALADLEGDDEPISLD